MSNNLNAPNRLFEFRIKYNVGSYHSEMDNYHYYNAYNSSQALAFHMEMIKKNKLEMQTLSVEKYNPYSQRWEDESECLNQYT